MKQGITWLRTNISSYLIRTYQLFSFNKLINAILYRIFPFRFAVAFVLASILLTLTLSLTVAIFATSVYAICFLTIKIKLDKREQNMNR